MTLLLLLIALCAGTLLIRHWLCRVRWGGATSPMAPALAAQHAAAAAMLLVPLAAWQLRPLAIAVTLDTRPATIPGAVVGGLLVLAWTLAGLLRLREVSARNWLPWLIVLPLAGPALGIVLMRSANIAFDLQPGQELTASVDHLSMYASGRGSKMERYTVTLDGDGLPRTRQEVTWRIYRRLREGDDVRVVTHDGAFGWPWLEGFEPRPAAPAPNGL